MYTIVPEGTCVSRYMWFRKMRIHFNAINYMYADRFQLLALASTRIACKPIASGGEKGHTLWHLDPLLGKDRERKNWTTAVTRQRLVNCNWEAVYSVRSVQGFYKQGSQSSWVSWLVSGWVSRSVSSSENCWGSVVVSCCCEKLVAEARDSSGTKWNGNTRRLKPLPSNGYWRRDCGH
jgi:hypothetical protein